MNSADDLFLADCMPAFQIQIYRRSDRLLLAIVFENPVAGILEVNLTRINDWTIVLRSLQNCTGLLYKVS